MHHDLLVPNCTAIAYLTSSLRCADTARSDTPYAVNNPPFASRQSQARRVTIAGGCHSSGGGDTSTNHCYSACCSADGVSRGCFCIQHDKLATRDPRMSFMS